MRTNKFDYYLGLWFLLFCLVLLPGAYAETERAADPIRLGGVFSLTSWGAAGGSDELNGAQLAVDEINASGGVNGRLIEFLIEDNRSDLKQTVSAYRALVDLKKIDYLVGPNWAEFSEILAPIANRDKLPLVTPSGYTRDLVRNRSFIFTLWPAHSETIKPFARHILAGKHQRIALVSSQNGFYTALSEGLAAYMQEQSQALTQNIELDPQEVDFKSVITKLKQSKVDAVVIFLLENGSTAKFLEQARALQLNVKFYAGPNVVYDHVLQADMRLCNGVDYFSYEVPATAAFNARFAKRFQTAPLAGAGKAYDAVQLYAWSMRTCGFDRDQVIACLRKADLQGVTGKLKFNADGNFAGSSEILSIYNVAEGKSTKVN